MKCVILESPFAGDVAYNIDYARMAVRDSLDRGEAPIASHLLYTQPGILNDNVKEERDLGVEAGLSWIDASDGTVAYADMGLSSGMIKGIIRAFQRGKSVDLRYIKEQTTDDHKARMTATLQELIDISREMPIDE